MIKKNPNFKNLIGQKFGMLTVIRLDDVKTTPKFTYWECECECGRKRSLPSFRLTSGKDTSCGCQVRTTKMHREIGNDKRMYTIYLGMVNRCHNPQYRTYKGYGAKGISVCDEWRNSFSVFREWAFAHGYDDTLSIDRINNDKGYEPSNCRWIKYEDQARNKKNNVWITHGSETHIMADWCKILGFPYSLAKSRSLTLYRKGITPTYEILFRPKGTPMPMNN